MTSDEWRLRRAREEGLGVGGFRLLGVVGSDRELDFFVRHQSLDVLPGEFHEKRRNRKTVDALQTNREAPVLGSLPFVGVGRGQVFGERQRRGRAGGGRAMEGEAGFHGGEGTRAVVGLNYSFRNRDQIRFAICSSDFHSFGALHQR